MRLRSAATVFLHRAQLIFMLAILVPTVLMTAIGILLLATRGSGPVTLIAGILVLAFCATALTGYILGTIFVTRGASLASMQNEFLSAVSHELRTPLTSIRMFIDTLREERVKDPVEKQHCLQVVHQELTRLNGLVDKIIHISRIESPGAAFKREPVTVADIVNEALVAFRALNVGRDVDLSLRIKPELTVLGDKSALAQALANLLANAWKYTPANAKRIEVTAESDLTHVIITVSDNGMGIPLEEQGLIFEKFRRGASAAKSGLAGTGLGLAVVRAIVTAHRGSVSVTSEAGQGSRFRISLPRHRAEKR